MLLDSQKERFIYLKPPKTQSGFLLSVLLNDIREYRSRRGGIHDLDHVHDRDDGILYPDHNQAFLQDNHL